MKTGTKNVYIFIGPPGSGKGTLSNLCAQTLGWVQLSTGNLCRKHIAEQSDIGKQIDFAIKSGKLISDSLITKMVEEWFDTMDPSIEAVILDGYPRTVVQAREFSKLLATKFTFLTLSIVKFYISDEQVLARLSGRYICQNNDCQAVYSLIAGSSLQPKKGLCCDQCSSLLGRREDDAEEAIRQRLQIYHKHEHDLLNFFTDHGYSVKQVLVEKPLELVFEDFKRMVGSGNL